jgi:predicted permease
VRDELRYHRDRLIDDYIAGGMERAAAERRAFLEFGNMAGLEDAVRDARGHWHSDFATDVRYALRLLKRSPIFAAVAVLSLALGIGANAAIFSVINAVLLRSLAAVHEPGRLVLLARVRDGRPLEIPFLLYETLRDRLTSVSGVAAVAALSGQTALIDGDDEVVSLDLVSGTYFDVLGIPPEAGRVLSPADDGLAPPSLAAVISDSYWRLRFGRSPDAIGKAVTLGNRIFTIVGVTAPAFQGIHPGRTPDLMVPLEMMLDDDQRLAMDNNSVTAIARLEPGATVARAQAEVQALYSGFLQLEVASMREKDRPEILGQHASAIAAPDGNNEIRYAYRRALFILMGSVGLVLLLACVNLSGLLLARAAARQRETAIRLALGAGRGRLVRQFLTESLMIAAIGGTIGLAIAGWLAARLFALFLNGHSVALSVAPDWRVVAFTCAVSAVACILAGLAPALHAGRAGINPALKEIRARGSSRVGKMLVVAQLAISMVLLVGAALFIGSLIKLHAVDRGFDPGGVLVMQVRAPRSFPAERVQAVESALIDRLRAMPGVVSTSASAMFPLGGGVWARNVQVEGYSFRADESDVVGFNAVAPDYFATIGTPVVYGRAFNAHDTAASIRVAVVNDSFARYFFRDGPALGRRVTSANVTYEIVGVVGDAKYRTLRDAVIKTMYIPITQRTGDLQPSSFSYFVRVASGDPRRLLPDLPRVVRDADPGLRLRRALPYVDLVDESIGTERIMATLGGVFGGLAMLVAALGLFGLLAFQVARRTNELGVRMALGAGRGSLMRLVLRDVGVMIALGIGLGSIGAVMTAGVARSLLFGLTPTDPGVFAVAATALALTALLAAWLPARRAANIDPLVALRHE